jgi:hypothetical protein
MADLLRLHRLAAHLRLPREWLRAEAVAGRLPCLRVGHVFLFSLSAVEKILAERAASSREAALVK